MLNLQLFCACLHTQASKAMEHTLAQLSQVYGEVAAITQWVYEQAVTHAQRVAR
jgi:hypothetical protein